MFPEFKTRKAVCKRTPLRLVIVLAGKGSLALLRMTEMTELRTGN
jgi:hypothetical protein